jgi:hypothetical protein
MSLWGRNVARASRYTLGTAATAVLIGVVPWLRLDAQLVRGLITERTTNTPIDGVVVSVVDTRDSTVTQVLSDDRGNYEVRLPVAGTYSLDVKRIGVKRLRLAPFTVGVGETHRLDVTLEPLAAVLSSVKVTGRTSCVRNPQTNAKTAALWEDARAALTAAVLTRGLTSTGTDSVVRFERKLDVASWQVLYENRRKVSTSVDHPFRSLPAEVLSAGGYVSVNQDGSTDYFAPDADALLSDAFLADHCFKIQPSNSVDHAGEIGLAFQPIPERKKPDVKGVLWLDEKTSELRTLEFNYTWLPYDTRTADFGGIVSFFRMPGGRWIVRSWRIRMPEFGHERTVEGAGGQRVSVGRSATPVLARISEEGGAVPLTTLLNQAGGIRGTVVVDTVTNKPIPGITVALEGTGDSTRTAVDGTYDLPFVAPGSYVLELRHPVLDSLGVTHLARTVDVEAGKPLTLNLRFPTNQELAERMCNRKVDFGERAVIRFLVVDEANGKPLANTPVVFSRVPIVDGKPVMDSVASYDVTLDPAGGFLACGLRGDEVIRVEAVPETPRPWGETVRPRPGVIGWHVIRVGKRR